MTENINIQNTSAKTVGMLNGRGFIGRYVITPLSPIEKLEKDLWCEGTRYTYCPFASTKSEFLEAALSMIAKETPSDIFSAMQNVKQEKFYVPMVVVDDHLICLSGEIPAISYDFFDNGTCRSQTVASILNTAKDFNPDDIKDRTEVEFLSIWLSLADVAYVANIVNARFDTQEEHQVILVPIHHLTFDYNGHHYTAMSYGDKALSNLTCKNLPIDDVVNGRRLLLQKPWISMTLLLVWLLGVVIATCITYGKLWMTVNWFFLFRLVVFAIPAILIYALAWVMMRGFGNVFRYTILYIEVLVARQWQRMVIRKNFAKKQADLASRFSGINVQFPNVSDIPIDTSPIKLQYEIMLDKLSLNKFLKQT